MVLHEGCHSDLSADFLYFGANDFPSKNPFKKCFKIVLLYFKSTFSALALKCEGSNGKCEV